jgi:Cof subfamily protein (haloacid dehalogenase superfamily)
MIKHETSENHKEIKAVFFDVDGTLLSHVTKKVPASTRSSLKALREKGIKIFISTGRHLTEMEKLPLNDLEFDGYITLNGQLIFDHDKHMLFAAPFNQKISNSLVGMFSDKKVPILLVEEKHIYINIVNDLVRQVQANISSEIPEVLAYDDQPIYQACLYLAPEEEEAFSECLPEGTKMVRWNGGGADIISAEGGKITGMKRLMAQLNLSQNEIMAFGDAENDIEMLQYAGIGVAMGNAVESVKETADYITDDIDKNGIQNALLHYHVI